MDFRKKKKEEKRKTKMSILYRLTSCILCDQINLLAPELFFLILAHPVFEM